MSRRAWAYVYTMLICGALLALAALLSWDGEWTLAPMFVIFAILATLAQVSKVEAPNHQTYVATLVFLLPSALLLPPFFFVLIVIICYSVQWVKERLQNSPHLRNWYLQPFNMAGQIIAGMSARQVFLLMNSDTLFIGPQAAVALFCAALVYVCFNHLSVGLGISLGRGISLRDSGVLDALTLSSDFVLLLLGAVITVLWALNPWLVPLALTPLILMVQALKIPQLKKEASTDSKTGLWNARHFTTLYMVELERARRFGHPLALLMADLDLLRNINNTYGHLAGDAILAGLGQIIRATLRDYDIAARFGGEEFAIVLPETKLADALVIAERLRLAVETAGFSVRTNAPPIHATMSVGVAVFPQDAIAPNELIHQADIAVYQAKLQGRNRVVSASEIPQSVKLQTLVEQERPNASQSAFVARPEIPGAVMSGVEPTVVKLMDTLVKRPFWNPRALLRFVAAGTMLAGVGVVFAGLAQGWRIDWLTIGLLFVLAGVAERWQPKLLTNKGNATLAATMFALGSISAMPGIALCVVGWLLNLPGSVIGLTGIFVFVMPVILTAHRLKAYMPRADVGTREQPPQKKEWANIPPHTAFANPALKQLNDELFFTMAKFIDKRDAYESGHATRVADYATAIAKELQLNSQRVEDIRRAALLHDIGKMNIDEQLLNKPTQLTGAEFAQIKKHSDLGCKMVETWSGLRHLAPFIRHHHEWWDGRGYPDQLVGDAIPLEARVLAISDAVDSMASERPYQRALWLNEIVSELQRCAGTQFDPHIAEVCIRILERDGNHLLKGVRGIARPGQSPAENPSVPFFSTLA